jgi:hypothetical protein
MRRSVPAVRGAVNELSLRQAAASLRSCDPLRIDILHGVLNGFEGQGETIKGTLLRIAEIK